MPLYYPIEKIVANYTNTFNVYLWMEYGSGTVDVGDCIASVSRQAMAAVKPGTESLSGGLYHEICHWRRTDEWFPESLSMQMKETVNRGFEVFC